MLIKTRTDRTADLDALQALMAHPQAAPATRAKIEQEIRNIRAGEKGERDAAYEIDFHHRNSDKWAVIHDLRIEWQGRVAQIDHLVINRCLDIWVCESKSFAQGVSINDHGEFVRFFGRTAIGIPSPLEQNRKHVDVLKALLDSSAFRLPTRLGLNLRPHYESVVLIANGARITRPAVKVPGVDRVVHADKFRSLLEKSIDESSPLEAFGSILKVVGAATLEEFARQIAALHRPMAFDWHARFGLPQLPPTNAVPPAREPTAALRTGAALDPQPRPAPNPPPAPPPSPRATSAPSAAANSDPHAGRLSTSKLAASRGGIGTQQMLAALVDAGYLVPDGDGHRLTPKGREAGAVHIEKSRYGPYFLWPIELALG